MEGEIFRTRPDRPLGPPSLLSSGYCVSFLGIKRPGRGVEHLSTSSDDVNKGVHVCSTAILGLHDPFEGEIYFGLLCTITLCRQK